MIISNPNLYPQYRSSWVIASAWLFVRERGVRGAVGISFHMGCRHASFLTPPGTAHEVLDGRPNSQTPNLPATHSSSPFCSDSWGQRPQGQCQK